MRFVKLTLPLILVFLFGLFGLGIQYVPSPAAAKTVEVFALWSRLIGGVAGLLGLYALLGLHANRMRRREEGWGYSTFFFLGFFLIAGPTVYNGGQGFWNSAISGGAYDMFYEYLYVPTGATIFSLLGFFMASAAVRSFRARSFETTILLLAAVIVMLGRAPLGEQVTGYVPRLTEWIMAIPNTAAKRGVLLGASLGAIATSFRIIFGIERSYLGGTG
jgi:uncharacterized membrane protein YhaH (DUF805 family)